MIVTIVAIGLVIWAWVTIRINRRKDAEAMRKFEEEDSEESVVVSMFHGVEDDILNNTN